MRAQPTMRLDLALTSPLGGDALRVESLSVDSGLSRCFEGRLQLLSEAADIVLEDLIGQRMSIHTTRPDGGSRTFSGFIESLACLGQDGKWLRYEAVLVPWLWFLTQSSNCRIFQGQSVPEIVCGIFGDMGFDDVEERLYQDYPPRNYCVQYRETDFNFVTRLLEEEGIFYYFRHDGIRHVLVLADQSVVQPRQPDTDSLPFRGSDGPTPFEESIWRWIPCKRVRPGTVSLNDFNEQAPRSDLHVRSSIIHAHAVSDSEIYDYPGRYSEYVAGERYARARIEEIAASHETFQGLTDSLGLRDGFSFELVEHPREDLNRRYLVTGIRFRARDTRYDPGGEPQGKRGELASYECEVTAIDPRTMFRPPRAASASQPRIGGPQTATVVGPPGEEIWTDEDGRVKVQFHWDREGQLDQASSCWVRVAQPWAGRGWGAAFIPRTGDEVVVEFLEGDPCRPLIVGGVYNGISRPPYSLPENATVTGVRTQSSKDGHGFNEIRLEDRKGEEEFLIRAEKDLGAIVGNDRTARVARDDYEDVQNNKNVYVKNDRTVQIDGNDSLYAQRDIRVIGDRTLTIVAAKEIKIQTGESTIFMKSDGTIIINGKNVTVNGTEQFAYAADTIVGDAGTNHHFKGATVKHNA